MRVDRLEMVERVLADVEERNLPFDISVWLSDEVVSSEVEILCGFAGCAIGWAARDKEVIESGLRLCSVQESRRASARMRVLQNSSSGRFFSPEEVEEWRTLVGRSVGVPIFGDKCGFSAVYAWLETTEPAEGWLVERLFVGLHYTNDDSSVTPAMVRGRVQQAIAALKDDIPALSLVRSWDDYEESLLTDGIDEEDC